MEFRVPTLREALGIVYTDFFLLLFRLEKHHFVERVLQFSEGFLIYIYIRIFVDVERFNLFDEVFFYFYLRIGRNEW